ncbi:MAG: BlaI/MecI/CopY family transcriptional regulator [Clostridia bacterium]|nr:BlaI/MecI/CopY family transcriptional regulator [Clostridia bacterium]
MQVQCTEAEWKIMEVLWENSPCTMPQITKALAPSTGWTRHTVITLLKRMAEKGSIAVDETGSVKEYTPLVSRAVLTKSQTKKLLNHVFSGRASMLVQNLVDTGEMTVKEIEDLLQMLKQKEP